MVRMRNTVSRPETGLKAHTWTIISQRQVQHSCGGGEASRRIRHDSRQRREPGWIFLTWSSHFRDNFLCFFLLDKKSLVASVRRFFADWGIADKRAMKRSKVKMATYDGK